MSLHAIYIGMGSNIDRTRHCREGVASLRRFFNDIEVSPVYESEAIGFEGKDFYNLVIKATTNESVSGVIEILKSIERDNGRPVGQARFAPKTLDLDLLLYDSMVCDGELELPRAEILYNAFVLRPLSEIAPELKHPRLNRSIKDLWLEFDSNSQRLHLIPLQFDMDNHRDHI